MGVAISWRDFETVDGPPELELSGGRPLEVLAEGGANDVRQAAQAFVDGAIRLSL